MSNSRYSIIIMVRVVFITLTSFVLVWFYTQTNRPATTLFFLFMLITQSMSLIYYLNRVNRDLANFLVSLQENDTMLAFSQKKIERNFKGIIYHLNKINRKLQEARIEKEQQHQYLQAVVEHIGIGLIAFNQQGEVEIINHSAMELFGIHSLHNNDKLTSLYTELSDIFSTDFKSHPTLLKLKTQKDELQLVVKSTFLKINDSKIKLVSFQNIKNELEIQELDSWRKLIRILRHEIMNSMTPITTFTTVIKRSFRKGNARKSLPEINDENIEDALISAEVIEERSKGLIDFVEKFRSLTDLLIPQFTVFPIKKIIDHVQVLFSDELKSKKITLVTEITDEKLVLHADEKLIEQVLINLLKNSIEAIHQPKGEIRMNAFTQPDGNICVQVIDNGIGIKDNALESVFVPSYTTKENGMGIGLSISKQIMQLHKATIDVRSIPGSETMFELLFYS
jgi:two-component system, NtrC family, nitrogen regulation sensor histidine kinase NtrY